jgi:hypothetical protein
VIPKKKFSAVFVKRLSFLKDGEAVSRIGVPSQKYSLIEEHLALQLFTNRKAFTKRFAEYLNDESPRHNILFFHGDAGWQHSNFIGKLRNSYGIFQQ